MSHVYIAHSPDNLDELLRIHEALRAAGIPDFYDTGASDKTKRTAALAAIDDAFAMIVLVSARAVRSREVQEDIERAKARGLTLLPISIDKGRLNGFFKKEVAPHLNFSISDPEGVNKLVGATLKRFRRRSPVIAVMNLKGGVGKTTVSAQVFGTWQASLGGRVLLIDLDPQYNLTQAFYDMEYADAHAAKDKAVISLFERSRLHNADAPSPAYDWATISRVPFSPPKRHSIAHDLIGKDGPGGRLDLIGGQFEISKYAFATDAEALADVKANFMRMVDHYRSQYDLIVFDTNPNATFLTKCALEAADRVLAPMHADVYSLRGVSLLNQVLGDLIPADKRPDLSILFNAVERREQSTFEADARVGTFDQGVGFPLSKALLSTALPRSGHLVVKAPLPETKAWQQLIIHNGRGGGLKTIRESLKAVAMELKELVT